jgi:hypothetical protein
MADATGRITISRAHADDVRQRQVVVRIDDGPRSTLMFGDSVTLDAPAGTHHLRAHNTLVWKTERFTLEPGGHLAFEVINHPGRLTLGFLALIGAAPLFLRIERKPPVPQSTT